MKKPPYRLAKDIPVIEWDELHRVLFYNPETGIFIWKIQMSPKALKGSKAGTLDKDGYRLIRIYGRAYKAHRLAWFMQTKFWPKALIDHRDGVPDNNVFTNLRQATTSQNGMNTSVRRRKNGTRGIFWCKTKKKWRTVLKVNGVNVAARTFVKLQDAEEFVRQRREEHHKEFANHK